MRTQFVKVTHRSKPSYISLPKNLLRAEDIDAIGNWGKGGLFTICFKSSGKIMENIDPVLGIGLYLQAMGGKYAAYDNFSFPKKGFEKTGYTGLMLMPDEKGSFLGILAENIAKITDFSTKKQKGISIKTISGSHFMARCTKEEATKLFERALNGENAALWHDDWKYDKPRLNADASCGAAPSRTVVMK